MTKISVLVPVHNGEKTIQASLESILSQTFNDFEVIIIDDCSTDKSYEIVSQIKDPRIVIMKNDHNIGLSASLNRALEKTRGEYIARHDSDDISIPNRFEFQARFLDANPDIGVLGGQMDIVDANGQKVDRYSLPLSHGLLAWNLLFDRSLAHPTVMMRKDLLARVGNYSEEVRVSQDHQLWTKLVYVTRFANLPDAIVSYRQGEEIPGRLKIREQFRNRMRSRQILASNLLRQEISSSQIRWMDASQRTSCTLLDSQKMVVEDLIIRLYDAYKEAGILLSRDEAEVYPDFLTRLLAVGRCRAQVRDPASSSGLTGLRWAATHPFRAIKKALRVGNYAGARSKASLKMPPKTQNGLSVVVLTHERQKGLASLLRSLLEQTAKDTRLELIIFNNSPAIQLNRSGPDSMSRLIQYFEDCKVIDSSYNWGTSARYAMAALANNETVLFLDDDLEIKDKFFVAEMFETFRKLGPSSILSCWNELWIEWDEKKLVTVSLDFQTPGVNDVIPTDTIGPGIVMFNRRIVQNPTVMNVAMQRNQKRSIVSDMAFPLAASLVHGAKSYYFPAWKKIGFHDEAHKGAIYQIPRRRSELLSLYKELYVAGYQPVLARVPTLSQSEAESVKWAAQTLPLQETQW